MARLAHWTPAGQVLSAQSLPVAVNMRPVVLLLESVPGVKTHEASHQFLEQVNALSASAMLADDERVSP
jgi:hypothetical protein